METETTTNGHNGTSWHDENVLKLDFGDGFTIYRFSKNHCIIHLKWVNVVVCKLASIELLKNFNGETSTHTGTNLEGLSMAKSGTI